MIRPLARLPRAWRMTEEEEAVIETVCGAASRRLKLVANMSRYGRGDVDGAAEDVIRVLDGMRLRSRS